jgi:uncharacterized membrane protein YtjA (UPF0391 family)
MTVGPEYPNACVSHIATPISAFAGITTEALYSGQTPTPVYEYTPVSAKSRSPISSIVMVASGLAVADPVIVGWQAEDLQLFPGDYQISLAQRIGVSLPTRTSSPMSAPTSNGFGTAAKAGTGVGAVLVAATIVLILVILCMRRRRKHASTTQQSSIAEMEDQDQNDTQRKWFFGGKWRNEIHADVVNEVHAESIRNELESSVVLNELDSRHVHIVPGSPAELDGSVPQSNTAHQNVVEGADQHNQR